MNLEEKKDLCDLIDRLKEILKSKDELIDALCNVQEQLIKEKKNNLKTTKNN